MPNDNFLILYFNYNLYKKIKINTIIFYINYELSLSSSIDLPEAIVPSLLIPIYRRQISSGRLVLFFHQPHPKTPTPSSAPWGSSTQARRRKAHGAPWRATRRLRLDLEGRHESHVAGVGAQFGEGRVVASDSVFLGFLFDLGGSKVGFFVSYLLICLLQHCCFPIVLVKRNCLRSTFCVFNAV